jgi:signal transduction histidine kinase
MARSLQTRLLAGYIFMVALAVFLVGGVLLGGFRRFYLTQARADLTERADYIADALGATTGDGRAVLAGEAADRFDHHSSLVLRVVDGRGRLLASSRAEEKAGASVDSLPGVRAALKGRVASAVVAPDHMPYERLYVAVPVWEGGREESGRPVGAVRLSLTLQDVNVALARLSWLAALAALLALGVCGVASALLARSVSAPLMRMSALADSVRAGRFGGEVVVESQDEIGRLAEALSSMSRRLAEAETERSAFLAAASHELRTPVTNIRATLEALLADSGAALREVRRARFLRGALGEADRLADLVRQLTESLEAQRDVEEPPRAFEPVGVAALVDRTVAAAGPRLIEKQLRVSAAVERDLVVPGDPGRLQQVLANLLENAIRFSPRGGEIALTAARDGGRARITVRDHGPGIAPAARERIFDRFVTIDPSRSRRNGGSGLGLYVARTIVEAHGGSIAAGAAPGGGALLTVLLPCASRIA